MQVEAVFYQIGVEGTDFKIPVKTLQKENFSEEDITMIQEFSVIIARQFCCYNMYADCIIKEIMAMKNAIKKFYNIFVDYFVTYKNETMMTVYTTDSTEFEKIGEYVRIYLIRKPDDNETLYLGFEHIIEDDFDERLLFEPYSI